MIFFQLLLVLNPKPSDDCLTRLRKLFLSKSPFFFKVLALLKILKANALVLC